MAEVSGKALPEQGPKAVARAGRAMGSTSHPDVAETSGQRIGVPGTVAGIRAAAERFGTRPWASYFDPSIAAAEDGFPMYSFLYGEMAVASSRLSHFPSGRERYAVAVRESGGTMTVEDMANYAVRWDEPTPFRFRGQDFLGSPPPDTGGP